MPARQLTFDDYEITRDGQVINLTNGHILKPQKNGKGYLRVHIYDRLYFVHRLVAEKYIPNPDNKPQVNHKDGNKMNNSVENLEWVNNQENRDHAVKNGLHLQGEKCPWAKLTEQQVEEIRASNEINIKRLAEKYNVSEWSIEDIIKGKTWKHIN